MRYVYVGNLGGFWRLAMSEWRAICEEAQADDWQGYDLTPFRCLRSKPAWLRKSDTGPGWWPLRDDVRYVEPIDWEPADFADELERLATLERQTA